MSTAEQKKPDSQNAAAPVPKRFLGEPVLPTENREDFVNLLAELTKEHAPEGPSETSIVFQIAILEWRLDNLDIFDKADLAAKRYPFVKGRSTLDEAFFVANAVFTTWLVHDMGIPRPNDATNSKNERSNPARRSTIEKWLGKSLADDYFAAHEKLEQWESDLNARNKPMNDLTADELKFISLLAADVANKQTNGSDVELAWRADAITPENLRAEFESAKFIQGEIDRNLERLWKLKENKRKSRESSSGRSHLLPPYSAGAPKTK